MTFDFSGQVAMITGASGNLGGAAVQAFRAAGAKLALVERHEELLETRFPDLVTDPDCFMSGCADLTNPNDVAPIVQAVYEYFGRIDILANTVGGYRAGTPIHETSVDTWDFMINLNARSVFITTQCVLPFMIRQEYGKIIHLAARPGLLGRANMSAYSASKGAVIRLTESASAEAKGKGVNINCILPGTIDTPANREANPNADFGGWVQPSSLASVILFLSSDAARDVHGAAIPVYGLT
jgi:NAD(P)-dependent dehydrogenase (short-subunit alcohol dehydrogenase family)